MSSDQGPKKGRGKGKRRNRGRGNQPRQSESVPGGLQQRGGQEREGATALPAAQSSQQPPQHIQSTPQQAEAVGQATQAELEERTPVTSSLQTQGKAKHSKQHRKPAKSAASPSKPIDEPSSGPPSGQDKSEKETPVSSPTKSDSHPSTPTQEEKTPPTAPRSEAPQAQSLVSSSQALPRSNLAEPRPPLRPDGGGKLGRPIKLRVNFLSVKLPEDDIHHYDTEIKTKGQKAGEGYTSKEAPRIIQSIVEQYEKANPSGPKLVYDKNGKNIYCKCPIPGIGKDRREFKVVFTTDNGKEREYTVGVKWVSQVSLYNLNQALEGRLTEIPRDTMQAVEVVLRHLPSMTSIPVGASFFNYPDGHEKDLGQGLQIWNGTFVSFRPTQWKMMLNIDTCSTAFYKAQPVLHFMCEYLGLRAIPQRLQNPQMMRKFGKEMKTIKIETTHVKRKQKVSGLSRNSARKEMFDCEGKMTSVLDYFKERYSITLKYPDLPCLKLGQKGNCIPMELCDIVRGQRRQGRLSADQTREMIRYTALPAPQRQQEISKLIRDAKFDQDPYCRDFGIRVGQDMARIVGRVLEPPVINYGPREQPLKETPRDGVWNMQHKSYQAVDLMEWAIVSYENQRFFDERGVGFFVEQLVQAGKEKGLRIHPSPCYQAIKCGYEGIGHLFGQLHKDYPNLQLIVVIFPGKGSLDEYYEEVKHYGDVIYGIRTQCIKSNTATKKVRDKQTMANICLKINAKLGGTTFIIDRGIKSQILKRPVIIFGADVTHPSPRDTTTPSIAAVVASMDSHPNLYNAEVRVQAHRQERIEELKDMVKVLLQKFRTATGAKPEKILFYRDGVSEGQFREVLIHELNAIQLACMELHPNFKPGITFIVVQKRHHTRFFAEDPRDQRGKSKNIPAGTVVDKQVCHPFEFDWYLCSHAGIQGTSKPAHYHVLYDDNNFKSDDLQILTNQLCHTYVRCARAVSIPAPAYYAHHVAFRARYHLSEVDRGSGEGSVASGAGEGGLQPEEMIRAVKVHENMNSTMYFA